MCSVYEASGVRTAHAEKRTTPLSYSQTSARHHWHLNYGHRADSRCKKQLGIYISHCVSIRRNESYTYISTNAIPPIAKLCSLIWNFAAPICHRILTYICRRFSGVSRDHNDSIGILEFYQRDSTWNISSTGSISEVR